VDPARTLTTVDPRVVINPVQARRFFAAVADHSVRGRRMKAFFGCLYYGTLGPEEASDLREETLASLPQQGWGEMILTHSVPRADSHWTDNGKPRQRRALKHRADGDTRHVPIHPELVALLREHLAQFGTGPRGWLFTGHAVGSSPTGPTSRCSTRPALRRSPQPRPALRCWTCPTPCATPRCPPGSTPESPHPS
jgi:integrase